MTRNTLYRQLPLAILGLLLAVAPVRAAVLVQCPGDTNGNAQQDAGETWPAHQKCMHLAAGDGFNMTADGHLMYGFGFSDVTGIPTAGPTAVDVLSKGMLAANFPAPTIVVNEDDNFYLTLTNVGMMMRPDLFDPHTVHFHGFPNAASVFDGLPEASVTINMGSSFTYYYKVATGHLHVPLPRRGHRAHADGDARQPLRPPAAERDPARKLCRRRPLHQVRLQRRRRLHRLRRRVPDPARLVRLELPRPPHRHPAAAVRQHARRLPAAQRPRLPGHGQPERPPGAHRPGNWGPRQRDARASGRRAVAADQLADHRDGWAEDPAPPLQPDRHQLYTVTALGLPMQVVGHDARLAPRSSTGANLVLQHQLRSRWAAGRATTSSSTPPASRRGATSSTPPTSTT